MERKNSKTRRVAKSAVRVAARERRCSHGAKLTARSERAIVVEKAQSVDSTEPAERAARGRVEVVETYFGADGKPIKRKGLGAARVARRYDERGNKVEEAYFNAEGKPTLRKDLGVARIAWRYDERGNPIEAAFFGADGAPIEKEGPLASDKSLFEDA